MIKIKINVSKQNSFRILKEQHGTDMYIVYHDFAFEILVNQGVVASSTKYTQHEKF